MIINILGDYRPKQDATEISLLTVDGIRASLEALIISYNIAGDWLKINSYLIVREGWLYENRKLYAPPYKLYPSPKNEIVFLNNLGELKNMSDDIFLEVQKIYSFKPISYDEPVWDIKIDGLYV